jgi:hypothetical protein
MRLNEALHHPNIASTGYGDLFIAGTRMNWLRRDHMVYAHSHAYGSQLLALDTIYGTLDISLHPLMSGTHPYHLTRNMVNEILPDSLRIKSVKQDRWVVTGHDNIRSLPFHNNISFHNPAWANNGNPTDDRWVVGKPLPYPDKSHIPTPIQHLVKKWAGSYNPVRPLPLRSGRACGMCINEDGRLTAATLDGGAHERQHLLDHILTGGLPGPFMHGILYEARLFGHHITPGDVAPFRQACYQVAVWYAYKTLRSTYA